MISGKTKSARGFTLVEVLIGLSLSLMILGAVLSSYVFLGRNFTRTLGITSANQPPIESQNRRTLEYFDQDARMASGITTTPIAPDANNVTLTLPTSGGSTTVTYAFDGTNTLSRTSGSGATQVLHTALLSCVFSYYDASGQICDLVNYPSYINGVKQISVTFTAQGGSAVNNTLTKVYTAASPRLLFRNMQLLP